MATTALVRRSDGQIVATAEVSVQSGEFDQVLSGDLEGDNLVPAGQNWLVGSPLRLRGNLRTDGGTISLRGTSQ